MSRITLPRNKLRTGWLTFSGAAVTGAGRPRRDIYQVRRREAKKTTGGRSLKKDRTQMPPKKKTTPGGFESKRIQSEMEIDCGKIHPVEKRRLPQQKKKHTIRGFHQAKIFLKPIKITASTILGRRSMPVLRKKRGGEGRPYSKGDCYRKSKYNHFGAVSLEGKALFKQTRGE